MVHFVEKEYTVDESIGSFNVSVELRNKESPMTCTYEFDFSVSVFTLQGTAGLLCSSPQFDKTGCVLFYSHP